MDLFKIKQTKMISEAKNAKTPSGSLIKTTLIFLLVYIIVTTAMSVVQSVPTSIYVFSSLIRNEAFMELISAPVTDFEAYMESVSLISESIIASLPSWLTLISLVIAGLMIVGAIVYCVKLEKRPITSMGIRGKDWWLEYLIGAGVGILMFSLAYLLAWATGSVEISVNETISPLIIAFFFAFIIQGASEEFLVRGYFMVSLARSNSIAVSVALSSIFFGIMHLGNAGISVISVINLILFGVFAGLYVFKRGSLWGACAIHTMWNFFQGNVFGSRVSGIANMPSFFVTTNNEAQEIINGGAFGLEGGLAVSCVLLLAVIIVLVIPTKKSEIDEEYAEKSE